jgi:hypothetical protein
MILYNGSSFPDTYYKICYWCVLAKQTKIFLILIKVLHTRCGLRASPAPRASIEPTAQYVYKLVATVRASPHKV